MKSKKTHHDHVMFHQQLQQVLSGMDRGNRMDEVVQEANQMRKRGFPVELNTFPASSIRNQYREGMDLGEALPTLTLWPPTVYGGKVDLVVMVFGNLLEIFADRHGRRIPRSVIHDEGEIGIGHSFKGLQNASSKVIDHQGMFGEERLWKRSFIGFQRAAVESGVEREKDGDEESDLPNVAAHRSNEAVVLQQQMPATWLRAFIIGACPGSIGRHAPLLRHHLAIFEQSPDHQTWHRPNAATSNRCLFYRVVSPFRFSFDSLPEVEF